MADAAGRTPLLHGLPDEISTWEILVRLPPNPSFAAVSCAVRGIAPPPAATSFSPTTSQPNLPLLCNKHYNRSFGGDIKSFDIIPCAHHAADKLQSVARLDGASNISLEACCDGLLVYVSWDQRSDTATTSICNPTTRQYARLHHLDLDCFGLLGMYPHSPTGDYRLVLYNYRVQKTRNDDCYVYTLGSGQPPRHIDCPNCKKPKNSAGSVLFRGSLHWHTDNLIMVFDATSESFRQMRSPIVPADDHADMFEMSDMLGMFIFNEKENIVDIWVMQDYEGKVWSLQSRVELPIAEIREKFQNFVGWFGLVAASWDGDVLLLIQFEDNWLLQVDMNGKLIASIHHRFLYPTLLRLKQSLVSHSFFPALEGYVINASPFHLT